MTVLYAASSAAQVPASSAGLPRVVQLRTASCAAGVVTADKFTQLLAIELSTANYQLIRGETAWFADLAVEVDAAICDAEARQVGVSFGRPSLGERHHQVIALHDVDASARPRALALAVAELVRRASETLDAGAPREAPPDEAAAPASARGSPTVRKSPSDARRSVEPSPSIASEMGSLDRDPRPFFGDLQVAGGARIFAPEGTVLGGPALLSTFALRPHWLSARVGFAAAWSSTADPLGDIGLGLYSGQAALLAQSGRFPELVLGPHFEIGYLRATGAAIGEGRQGGADGRAVAFLSLTMGARFWFGRWAPLVDVDVGTSIAGAEIYAGERRVGAVFGAYAGARGGIAFGY